MSITASILIEPSLSDRLLAEAFERVEHEETGAGVHEKYLAVADELEREANA